MSTQTCSARFLRTAAIVLLLVGSSALAIAQFPEDALRFSSAGYGVGARALGMGNAYKAVASDFSALYWNPAGLAQAKLGEFSFGLSQLNTGNTGTYFGQDEKYTNNGTALNSLGFVFPAPVRRGALVLALGFTRRTSFTSGLSFSGFNPISSIIQTWAPDGQPYPADLSLAEELWLAQADTATGRFRSPINKNVTQLGTVIEERGLNNWSAGGALDIAKNVSVGVTLTYISGSYRYERSYREQDNRRIYASPFDFRELTFDEFVESDITGVNALFGLMYRDPDHFRVALTVATPTSFTVQERFGTSASSSFYTADNSGQSAYQAKDQEDRGEYDIRSPWVLGAGGSVILGDLLLSADVETIDWTTTEFANANKDVLAQNKVMKTLFRSVLNYRGGAEFEIPGVGVRLRGGYSYEQSPFAKDPKEFDRRFLHAGVGIPLAASTMIDAGYSHGWWRTYRTVYDAASRVDEKVTTNYFLVTLTHRF